MKIPYRLLWIIAIAVLITGISGPVLLAQDEAVGDVMQVPEELASPRATYETLTDSLDRMKSSRAGALETALTCLDLTNIPEVISLAYGEEILWKLSAVLESQEGFDPLTLSDDPSGAFPDVIPAGVEDTEIEPVLATAVIFSHTDGNIVITQGRDNAWRLSEGSLMVVALAYRELELAGEVEADYLPEIEVPSEVPANLANPKACYETYLEALGRLIEEVPGALTDATVCFDVSRTRDEDRATAGADAARQLGRILQASPPIDPETIPDDLTGPSHALLSNGEGSVVIDLSSDGTWLFSGSSLKAITEIYFVMVDEGSIDILAEVEVSNEIPQALATPRSCFLTFYNAMKDWNEGTDASLQDAIDTLDLSDIGGGVVQEYGSDVVRKLAKILDYIPTKVDPETIPHDTSGPSAVIFEHSAGSIEITHSDDGAWRFSATTVEVVPEIFREMVVSGFFEEQELAGIARSELSTRVLAQELDLESWMPASWRQKTFLIENWQWLFLILLIFIGLVIDKIVPWLFSRILRLWLKTTFLRDRLDLIVSTSRPFGFLAMSGFWWLMLASSGLDVKVLNILLTSVKFMTAAGFVWCAYRAVDIVSEFIEHNADRTASRMDDLLAPFIRKSLKVVVAVFGIIFIAGNIDVDVSSLLAGLGIGGIAIALAAKDTLENLFGSITVLFDRPFQVGDWIVVGDVEGTVEELGFRSTRIRTFYNSVVTMPNSNLVSSYVDNYGAREFRRVKTMIGVTYDTPPDKIEAFCEGIRELLRAHPYTRKDYFHVWLNQFSSSSLDILLYCFMRTPEWSTELRERHRLFLDIIRLANELGIEFAFPTQSIYMAKEKPLEPVFPDTGDIKAKVIKGMESANDRARRIAESQLGGKGVVPPPVDIGDRWADDGSDAGDG